MLFLNHIPWIFRELWDYLSNLSVEMNRLTDSIKEDPDKIAIHLKTAPEKRYFFIAFKQNILRFKLKYKLLKLTYKRINGSFLLPSKNNRMNVFFIDMGHYFYRFKCVLNELKIFVLVRLQRFCKCSWFWVCSLWFSFVLPWSSSTLLGDLLQKFLLSWPDHVQQWNRRNWSHS